MDNIYDIRKEQQLQFILPTEQSIFSPSSKLLRSSVVVVNLYYTEKVNFYISYLNCLPEEITLYVFSSKEETLEKVQKYCCHKNSFFLKKDNRGRDLSTFLVAFKPYIDEYELVCFIHDKREYNVWEKKDTDKWNENLWSNMIATKDYVYNILQLFEKNSELGMLVPPEPLGEYVTAWYQISWAWGKNFIHCKELAKKMELSTNISKFKIPITLSSVFWTRKCVLQKLLDLNWRYEDFPDEPMPRDGTISHAIERIFGYVSQDAGYDVATVMTEQYASWMLLFLQDYVGEMFSEISNRMEWVENFYQLRMWRMREKKILQYINLYKKFFLYGAGKYGICFLNLLREKGIEPTGFLVTNGKKKQDIINRLPVYELKDLEDKEVGIILTVYYPLQQEMVQALRDCGINNFIFLFE